AVDGAGAVHVSYVARLVDGLEVRHARLDGDGWHVEPVSVAQDYLIGQVVEPSGTVHLSFVGVDHGLKYARHGAGGWDVMSVADNGFNSDLAGDAAGAIHVAYHGSSADTVDGFVEASIPDWSYGPVVPDFVPNLQLSLVVAPGGQLVVAFGYGSSFSSAFALSLGRRTPSGAWSSVAIDTGNTGHYPALAIDPGGTAH